MKFGQLIGYNMRNIFLEKVYTECGREASLRPFSEKSKLSISLDQQSELSYSLLLLYAQVKLYQNILKPSRWPLAALAFTLNKLKKKQKNKKRSGTSLPASFSAWFFKKNIYHVIFC